MAEQQTEQQQQQPDPSIAAAAAAAAATKTPEWFDDSHKELVTNKGFKNPNDALNAYKNLESLVGADKAGRTVVKPKDANDAEGIKAFRAAMGVPETADKYELPFPKEGDDGAFAKLASQWFLDNNVSKDAAVGIATKWNEFITAELANAEKAEQAESEKQLTALKTEWGADYAERSEIGGRMLKAAGLADEQVKAIERSLGTAQFMKLFSTLGQKIGESKFVEGQGAKGFSTTQAQAAKELQQLTQDRLSNKITEKQFREDSARLGPLAYPDTKVA